MLRRPVMALLLIACLLPATASLPRLVPKVDANSSTEIIQNGGFETGNFAHWIRDGSSLPTITLFAHSGTYAANLTLLGNGVSESYSDLASPSSTTALVTAAQFSFSAFMSVNGTSESWLDYVGIEVYLRRSGDLTLHYVGYHLYPQPTSPSNSSTSAIYLIGNHPTGQWFTVSRNFFADAVAVWGSDFWSEPVSFNNALFFAYAGTNGKRVTLILDDVSLLAETPPPPPPITGRALGDTSGAGAALSSRFLVWNATGESMSPQAYNLCPNGELALASTACMSTTSPDWLNQTLVVGETLQLWTYSPPPGGIPFSHFEYSGTGLGTFTDQGPDTCPIFGGSCEYYTATAGGEGETGTVTLVFEAPVVTLHAYPAYRGAVTVWNYSETPDTFNLYWSLDPSFASKTLWANVPGSDTSNNATLPADTWGQTTYLQVVPVVGGDEQLDSAGTAQTQPATHRAVSDGSTIIISTTSEIKVRLDYRSLNFDPISDGVQIGEILTSGGTPSPRTTMMASPINLAHYNSTGYYIIDYTPEGGIAPGTYQVWFFLWNRLPSEGGSWEAYLTKVTVEVTVT